ncbi:MAG: ABC-2 family transporter protein [Candidatus Kerfeldbacteria bacterium]|nr:ABC-2 family transporter protein [Candidatus Kerfeldbacteria bacterium]
MLRVVIVLIFFQAVFLHVNQIGSWHRDDILVLLAVYFTIESLIIITFHRNLAYYFPSYVRKGSFDHYLTKPIPVLPHVAFRVVDLMDTISTLPVGVLWAYLLATGTVHLTVASSTLFVLSGLLAIVFTFGLSTIVAAISFWSISQTGLGRLYEQLFRTGRYPTDALGSSQGFLFTYILPFITVGTLPASALNHLIEPTTLAGVALSVLVFALLARMLWRRGLRRYSSASS